MKRFVFITLTLVTVFVSLFPIIWILLGGLKTSADIVNHPVVLLPHSWYFQNFRNVLENTKFLEGLKNSLFVAVPVTAVTMALSVFLSYTCTRFRFMGRWMVEQFALVAYVFPTVLLALPLFVLFANLHITNTLFGLAVAHLAFVFPLAFWMIHARMKEVSPYIEEPLKLDGADALDLILYVWIPHIQRHLFSVAGIVFIISMNDYVFARFLLVGDIVTLPLVIQGLYDLSSKDWGLISAAGGLAILFLSVPFFLTNVMAGNQHYGGRKG